MGLGESLERADRDRYLEAATAIATVKDPKQVSAALATVLFDTLRCERASCVFHDPDQDLLWAELPEPRQSNVEGLVGATVLRSGTLCVRRADENQAYRREIDDPEGNGTETLLLQPVVGVDHVVHAVLVAVRKPSDGPFGRSAIDKVRELARYVAPSLEHLSHVIEAEENDEQTESELGAVFRQEALDELAGVGRNGDVVRILPHWIAPVSAVVVAFFVGVLAFMMFGRVHSYSSGMGVLRAGNRTAIVSRESGTVAAIEVEPGRVVRAGEVLARLDAGDVEARLTRLEAEFFAQLRNRMRDPGDEGVSSSILALHASLEEARAQARRREIRAPHPGRVVDIRAAVGQPIEPGDAVLTMSTLDDRLELVALLPGDDRPQIEPGMQLRFELPGYQHEPQWYEIREVSDSVVGPKEATRQLGPDVADVVQAPGPSIIVRASVPSPQFAAGHDVFAFHDGMYGTVEVRLRREPVIQILIPGLSEVLR